MAEKLLSIIIPTKDREYYCKRVLDYMLSIGDERMEFVIQNNGLSDELDEYIKKKDDSRIVYKHVYEPLCQVDNSDQSIALSSGLYLCFLGDDDIVLPNIMQIVEYAINNNIDNIAEKNAIGYMWPSDRHPTGLLYFKPATKSVETVKDQRKCLETYLRRGCCEQPIDYKLPVLYHGITKRECIENVKKETGHYVGGSSPDSYTSVALAKYVKNQVIIDNSFSIWGACPQSATALNVVGGHCGTLEDAPHLKNRGRYDWDYLIPRYYSVQTVWAESAITALRETNNPSAENLNLKELFCQSYLLNKTIQKLIIKETHTNVRQNNINPIRFWIGCFLLMPYKKLLPILKRIVRRISRMLRISKELNGISVMGVKDISDCVKYICVE